MYKSVTAYLWCTISSICWAVGLLVHVYMYKNGQRKIVMVEGQGQWDLVMGIVWQVG